MWSADADQGLGPVLQLAQRSRGPAVGLARRRDFGRPRAEEAGNGRLLSERYGTRLFGQRERAIGIAWVELRTGLQPDHEGRERIGLLDLGERRDQARNGLLLAADRRLQPRTGGSRFARDPRHLLGDLLLRGARVEQGSGSCQRELAAGHTSGTPLAPGRE